MAPATRRNDQRPQRRADVMHRSGRRSRSAAGNASLRHAAVLCALCAFLCAVGTAIAAAQEPPSPQTVSPAQLQAAIAKLGDLDYATRTAASRTVRRTATAQAVPALLQAVTEQG